jgi:transposase InsO family protein
MDGIEPRRYRPVQDVTRSRRRQILPRAGLRDLSVESFNVRFRGECLNQHQFADLVEARALIEDFRGDYNRVRPHTSLGGLSPEQFLPGLAGRMAPAKPDHATQPQHDLPFLEETPCPVRLP